LNPALLLAILAGVAVALQASVNVVAQRTLGLPVLIAISGATTGLVALVVALLLSKPDFTARAVTFGMVSGLLGAFILGSIAFAASQGGIARTLALVIGSQLLVGAVADRIGLFGVDLQEFGYTRILGLALILVGGLLLIRD
jgi:bacterial/archaeal transporter family-2 protein